MEQKTYIAELENELKLIQQELSQRRKKAEDVKIAELLYLKIKGKITMAAATGLEKDIENAHNSIGSVWSELGKTYKRKTKDEKAGELVEEMRKAFTSGNTADGKRIYAEIRQLYPELSGEKKKEVAREIAKMK